MISFVSFVRDLRGVMPMTSRLPLPSVTAQRRASPARALLAAVLFAAVLLPASTRAQPRPDAGTSPSGSGKSPPAPASSASSTPAPSPPAPAPGSAATLERLRAEHAAVKDALFRSRARRETLESALLSTQLTTVLTWEGGRRHVLKAAEVRLDGARLWDAGETPPGDRPVTLAPRGVPPGTHVLGVRVEVRGRENPKLGYVSEQTFTLVLAEGKKTTVSIVVDEDGDLPGYNPDIEVNVSQGK
jgi:hypothetical protein